MAQVYKKDDRLIVELLPEEILNQRVYIQTLDGQEMLTTVTIGEAIRTAAWRLLHKHAKAMAEEKEFLKSEVVVMGGKFWSNFYWVQPKMPPAPKLSASEDKPPWEE